MPLLSFFAAQQRGETSKPANNEQSNGVQIRHSASTSASFASMPATAPISRASTTLDIADEVSKDVPLPDIHSPTLPAGTVVVEKEPRISMLQHVGGRTSHVEKGSTYGTTSEASGGSGSGPLNVHEVPLSNSSREIDSAAFTDDLGDYDAAEEDDGSVGGCTVHDVELTSSVAKPRGGAVPSLSSAKCSTPLTANVEAAGAAVSPQERPHPFSSLSTSPTSWGAMRKLRLEKAQSSLTGSSSSNVPAVLPTDAHQHGSVTGTSIGQLRQKSTQPMATAAAAGRCASPTVAEMPRSAMRDAVSCSNAGGSSSTGSSSTAGSWSLAPRLCGVNELLLDTNGSVRFRAALDALAVWHSPLRLELHDNSAGGTYMVRRAPVADAAAAVAATETKGEVLCVFKPRDEEIGQETNPHGNRESDRTEAFAPGSGSRREVLAYLLDHGHNAGVPPTLEVASGYSYGRPTSTTISGRLGCVAEKLGTSPAGLSDLSTRTLGAAHGDTRTPCVGASGTGTEQQQRGGRGDIVSGASTLPQIGSLQLFLPGCQEAADMLPGRFDADEVHALAIFDIRTLNGDRHGGNVLVQNAQHRGGGGGASSPRPRVQETGVGPHLIPIDHSYICPSGYADPDYEWLSWPQSKKPFSSANLHYIAALNAEADAELVRAALLAHRSGGYGGEGFDVRASTALRDGERGRYGASSFAAAVGSIASRFDSSSPQSRALQLDDGVRHACTVAQSCGVHLDASLCSRRATSPFTPAEEWEGENFCNLTVFSPVQGGRAPRWEDLDASPRGFSTTAPPEPRASQAAQWDAATALLLDFSSSSSSDDDDDEGSESDDDCMQTRVAGVRRPTQSQLDATPDTSVASPVLSFEMYGGGVDGSAAMPRMGNDGDVHAITYDRGAANAAAELMRCTTRLLQIAALEFGMTAYAIGSLCRRPRVAQASFLESAMEETRDEDSWEVVQSKFDDLVRHRLAADTADEIPRPPGRRSIQLYGTPPILGAPTSTGTAPRSALLSSVLGTTSGITTPRPGQPPTAATAAAATVHVGLPSAVSKKRISAVSTITAAGSGEEAAESVATTTATTAFPRQLRGRLNEGTVHRAVQPPQPPGSAAGRPTTHGSGRGPRYGSSVVSWVPVAPSSGAGGLPQRLGAYDSDVSGTSSLPQSRRSRDNTAVAIAEMVNEASLRNTWAMRFDSTAALRQAVSSDADAYTQFEDALVDELNALRRAPATYADIVERDARLGAPYVLEGDTFFLSESAAEDAAVQLRRRVEQEAAQDLTMFSANVGSGNSPAVTSPATAGSGGGRLHTASLNPNNVSPKHGGGAHSSGSNNATLGAAGGTLSSPNAVDRKKGKKRHSGNATAPTPALKDGAAGGAAVAAAKEGLSQPFSPTTPFAPANGIDVTAASSRRLSPVPALSDQSLNLAELRHQFRCQQRYRATLETAVRELRATQRLAVAAQLAAWTAEDEKAQKRARRSTALAFTSPASATPGNASAYGGASTGGGGVNSKRRGSGSLQRRVSPAMDENAFARRNEEATQIHRAYEQRMQHVEAELLRARSTCQRSLAGGNLISSAVRALRGAQPAPPVKRSRGLSLAARDTAEVYYGDEERVAALRELSAISRATLVGLTDGSGGSRSPTNGSGGMGSRPATATDAAGTVNTLEELSVRWEHHAAADTVMDADGTMSPAASSAVLPVLSEEALLLAQVAQRSCTTYGYISNEIRGVHLQGVGTPRMLLLQLLVGSLVPVFDIAQQQPTTAGATARAAAATEGEAGTGTQCFAGVCLEGKIYAARPDVMYGSLGEKGDVDAAAESSPQCDGAGVFNGDSAGMAGHVGPAKKAAEEAAQRLWPLLWPAASTIGCGWQLVRGWQHVPTYTQAYQKVVAQQQGALPNGRGNAVAVASRSSDAGTHQDALSDGVPSVVCSTLLLASGFEEYEVGRACAGMTPAATRRVIQGMSREIEDAHRTSSSSTAGATGMSSTRGGAGVRRAAIEVHSRLGASLLTPTMHPLLISTAPVQRPRGWGGTSHSGNSSGTTTNAAEPLPVVVCVAVRVPYAASGTSAAAAAATVVSPLSSASRRVGAAAALPTTVRVVAQVTQQGDPTPLCPSADAAAVLTQRSPVDPSVWLVFVDTTAAFARCEGPSSDGRVTAAAEDGEAASASLALHLFAKDLGDITGGYEHVAFIRLQRGDEATASASAAASCSVEGTVVGPQGVSRVQMAPEWRYLLKGLSTPPAPSTAGHRSTNGSSAVSSGGGGGWAVLHEPLLGRDGVVLCPLAANFRATIGLGSTSSSNSDAAMGGRAAPSPHTFTAFDDTCGTATFPGGSRPTCVAAAAAAAGAAIPASCGEGIHLAIQLPVHANALWWRHRRAALLAARDKLAAEMAAEDETEEGRRRSGAAEGGGTAFPPTTPFLQGTPLVDGVVEEVSAGPQHSRPASASLFAPDMPPSLSTTAAGPTAAVLVAVATVLGPAKDVGGEAKKPSSARPASTEAASTSGGNAAVPVRGAKGAKGPVRTSLRPGANAPTSSLPAPLSPPPPAKNGAAFSGSPLIGGHRAQSAQMLSGAPASTALQEYAALLSFANPPSRATAAAAAVTANAVNAVGVHPSLQATRITLPALRHLHDRLRDDSAVWRTHLQRIQPIFDSERERIATEAAKRKGKEQQRLQHDQDDITRELAEVQRREEDFGRAVRTTYDALRKRERAQVLRRVRLTRVSEDLARLEAAATGSPRAGEEGSGGTGLAAPRVTLRLFNSAAVAVGSGRRAATQPPSWQDAPSTAGTTGEGAAPSWSAAPSSGDVVVLQPQPSIPLVSSSPKAGGGASGGLPGIVYTATCTVPASFAGQATLLIDDEVAVTWNL